MESCILPYVSNEEFCGVCMKTAADGTLVPNIYYDFFASVQIYPAPRCLCLWCRQRIRTFTTLRNKALQTHQLLTVIQSPAIDPFIDRKCIELEIIELKRETLIAETVLITEFLSLEPEHVETKAEGGTEGKKRGRRRKKEKESNSLVEDSERVDIKADAELEDNDSWDMLPLKFLKDEDQRNSPETQVDSHKINNEELFDTANRTEEQELENCSKNCKKVLRKPKIKKTTPGTSKRKKLKEINQPADTEPKEVDINTAIDDLDNEGYIVSEEVHQHVETINLSVAGDRQRALRMRKPAYVDAVLRCEVCALGYQTQEDYDAHMHNHSPMAGSHCCHPCDMYFEKHRELEKHVQSHYRRHRCRICSHGSIDYRAAVKHYISQHSRVQFTCWHCNKEFRRPINLKKHMQKLHKKEKTDGCAVCGEEFSDADQLQQHMQSHKPDEISWHECPICKKKSRHKYNMEQHIKAHEKESMPIVCNICHKTFKTQVLLTTHIQRLHTENSKKFQCDECGKFFYDKGELRIHVQWTHKREGGVQCSQCVRKFRTAYLLNDHFRRVHENIPKPKDKLCDLCGRGFSSRKSLKCHRYIHTGERPHACPDCGQTFRQRCAMRLHYKSKHLHMRWKQLTKQKKSDHVSL